MFDIVIKDGLIIDGTGRESFQGDIGIIKDKITKIGKIDSSQGKTIIDAKDKLVVPGIIDPHTHADLSVLISPNMEIWLKQGVTSVVTGNCGHSMAPLGEEILYMLSYDIAFFELCGVDPSGLVNTILDKEKGKKALKKIYNIDLEWETFDEYYKKVNSLKPGCNIIPLAGYNAIRTKIMGKDCMRKATLNEISELEKETEQCMKDGAFGLSTGRDPLYVPGPFVEDEEIISMLKIVKKYQGIFCSHTYNVSPKGVADRIEGYKEMVNQSKLSGVKMNVSHVHVLGMANTKKDALDYAKKTVKYFDCMRNEGVDLSYDTIPVNCADFEIPNISFFLKPLVLMCGSRENLAKNLKQKWFRDVVKYIIKNGKMSWFDPKNKANWYNMFLILKHKEKMYIGKTIAECAEIMNKDLIETLMDLFCMDYDMSANLISPDFSEAMDLLCKQQYAMPCSDGFSFEADKNIVGNEEIQAYPNKANSVYFSEYMNRCKDIPLEQRIYKATGLVADRFGISKRGTIKEDNYADIAIFDVKYQSTSIPFENAEWVIVNGKLSVSQYEVVQDRNGNVLRKNI